MTKYLGTNIKKLRLNQGLTQLELGERLNVSAQAVSKWENNSATPDIDLLPAIAKLFDLSIDDLFHSEINIMKQRADSAGEEAICPDCNNPFSSVGSYCNVCHTSFDNTDHHCGVCHTSFKHCPKCLQFYHHRRRCHVCDSLDKQDNAERDAEGNLF